jgi:3-oxoacyl-[acyl-carrier-protein] synthase III
VKSAMTGVTLVGSGSAVPPAQFSNDELSQIVETSDDWIRSRTGIGARRIAAPGDHSLVELAAAAAQKALESAGVAPESVDLIVLATSSADDLFGSAAQVQKAIGAGNAVAFDLTAACSGFVFGLVTASQFIRSGAYQTVLVIGADVLTRWVDWTDRGTCILFGDGAGAVVLKAAPIDNLLGFSLHSDGGMNSSLNLPYRGDAKPLGDRVSVGQGRYTPITMNGQEVYRFAVKRVPEVIEKALFHAELTTADVDWMVLHQANQRILDAVADRLTIPRDRLISNLAHYGNTSAASIPLALDEAVRSGQIQVGQTIATAGFGAGLSWGAAVFRWGA